jgi:hypothetical protein
MRGRGDAVTRRVGEVKFKVQSLRPFAVPAGHRQETKGSKFKIKRGEEIWRHGEGQKGEKGRERERWVNLADFLLSPDS